MQVRRIVTGNDSQGKSIFTSDEITPRFHSFVHVPGFETALVWGTNSPAAATGEDPTAKAISWLPQAGGTKLMVITFPPDSVMGSGDFDPAAAGGEYMETIPGLAERFEMDNPGMHTTPTVDYGMLLDGEIHLELDNSEIKKLAKHDVVIQQGTRHAWRNRSAAPATMLFVLIGTSSAV